jgi:putative oxidoreductase
MKIAVVIARVLLGLVFVVFGLNVFFPFIPQQPMAGDIGTLTTLMFQHRWFHFYALLYVVGGLLLLIGRYVPIGLVVLGPILVNVLLFHLTLNPSGIGPGVVCTVLEVFLIYAYWPAFEGIFTPSGLRSWA